MHDGSYDIVMLGTFGLWRLGTLQARALSFARELAARGYHCAIVTSPWDMPSERGVVEVRDDVLIVNTRSASAATIPAVRQQLDAVRQLRPRLVHLFKPRGFGGLAARRLLGRAPVIVDSDDWEGDGGWNRQGHYSLAQRRLFDWQERTLLRDADGVTAASTLLEHRAIALRGGSRGVWRLPNGLSPSWIDTLANAREMSENSPGPASEPPTVLLYSRFEEFEPAWPDRFAHALRAQCRAVRIIAVGGGGSREIEQLGYVARHRLPDVLGRSSLAVFPYQDSIITRSKQSVKLLELMAAGCAVVASDVGDVATVLGSAGRVVPGHDPVCFASASAELLADAETRRILGEASRQRVREHFSIPTIVDDLVGVYAGYGLETR